MNVNKLKVLRWIVCATTKCTSKSGWGKTPNKIGKS